MTLHNIWPLVFFGHLCFSVVHVPVSYCAVSCCLCHSTDDESCIALETLG